MHIISTLDGLLAKSSAVQRWQGAKNAPEWHFGWEWMTGLGLAMFIVIAGVGLIGFLRTRKKLGKMTEDWYEQTRKLSGEEIELLTRLIQQSGLIRTEPRFTLHHAFQTGMNNYLSSETFCDQAPEDQIAIRRAINELRRKLAIDLAERDDSPGTQRIPVGSILTVMNLPEPEEINIRVEGKGEDGLLVEPTTPVDVKIGRALLIRHFDGERVWEINTRVSHRVEGMWLIEHDPSIRPINVRRFVRVPIQQRALVGVFPFHTDEATVSQMTPPSFVNALLMEIAGPGLMLEVDLELKVGQRILVVFELDNKRQIQSVGRVRRVNYQSNPMRYGVELVGLKPSQIAELMNITNTRAIEHHKQEEDQSGPENAERTGAETAEHDDEQAGDRDMAVASA